jgi:hypothetical protein
MEYLVYLALYFYLSSTQYKGVKLPPHIEGELAAVPGAKELVTGLLKPQPKE